MRNKWLLIVGACISAGIIMAYLTKDKPPADEPYLLLSEGNRARIHMPDSDKFAAIPLERRVYGAHEELVSFLHFRSLLLPPRKMPVALKLATQDTGLPDLLQRLPAPVQKLLSKALLGIYLTSNLNEAGFTQYAFSTLESTVPLSAFVVLDLGKFQSAPGKYLSLDEWLTRELNAAFAPHKSYRLEVHAENSPNQANVLEYAALRELGRVLSLAARVHPLWDTTLWPVSEKETYAFPALSWHLEKQAYKMNSNFNASSMKSTYDALATTDFPTLKAAQSPYDDFAESFANYIHTMVFKQPFEVRLITKGRVIKTYPACWTEQRCAAKRAFIEELISR